MNNNIKKYLSPKKYLDFFVGKVKQVLPNLEDDGERLDMQSPEKAIFLSQNEKCHLARYQFALSIVEENDVVGDFACGTGYGSILLSKKVKKVVGVDLNEKVINTIRERYKNVTNVEFVKSDLLDINYENVFDCIVSFETLEHFKESDILKLLDLYNKALKSGGKILFSTPYMQEMSKNALKQGFHQIFEINEDKVKEWLKNTGFSLESFKYQNYDSSDLRDDLINKDFIIGVAKKIN